MKQLINILISKSEFTKEEWIIGAVASVILFVTLILASAIE